ncbi:Leucine-rich repeat [Sesbania bispinosa]|nr:Leucine-rich repeat [Sesbania bispinosa]
MTKLFSQSAFLSLILLPFAIICNLGLCDLMASPSSCNQKDKEILLCFKHGLTDPSGMLSSWSTKEDCCEWRGVHCDDITGRVTNVTLPCSTDDFVFGVKNKAHCLTGEFHLSLLKLEYLKYLNLSNNNFQAIHLPLDCHNLPLVNSSNLVYLDLSSNENLVIDDLRWLLNLSSLEYLNLNSIDLHKQTQWLQIMTKLSSLSELHLRSCLLESASASLDYANFTSLEYIDLSDNDLFSELPNWLFNLTGLSNLILEGNRFHGEIPNTLLNLGNLYSLRLNDNRLSGSIPNCFDVQSNNLIGSLPESFGQLSNLEKLYVGENSLSGIVSHKNFANLSKLQRLYLDSPSFVFDFDPHWTPPFQLQHLLLGCVDLKLVPWLYTQTSLDSLTIFNSSFTSESPDKFWSWATDLRFLSLFFNSMHWDMSNVLLNSQVIWLVANGLSGGLPRLTTNVRLFQIGRNNLSGPLSPLLCHNMTGESNLQYLSVYDNYLSEGLTDCWVNWKSLVHVDLENNNLTGMIPHSMGTLSNLLSLYLHNNKLQGTLFSYSLLVLTKGNELDYNRYMRVVDFSSNQLSGKIPLEVFKLTALGSLNLSHNQLMGTIPEEIGNMKQLESLDLSTNKLSGEIPPSMSALSFLGTLNLSFNNFKGQIPLGTQLQGFTALSYIGNPQLCGTPLTKKCSHDEAPTDTNLMGNDDEEGSELLEGMYMGMGVGFAISFWVVCGSLFFKRTWRHAYFRFLNHMKDKLYVMMVLKCTPSVEI